MTSDWHRIGIELALEWRWIDYRFTSDWDGLAMDWQWIGIVLALDWHRIGNGLALDWLLVDIRLSLD